MPKNLGRFVNEKDIPRKEDIIVPNVITTPSATIVPIDNTIYDLTISEAVTIDATAVNSCPLYSSSFILNIASGGSITINVNQSAGIIGDSISSAVAGDIWEINIFRGNVIVAKIKGA